MLSTDDIPTMQNPRLATADDAPGGKPATSGIRVVLIAFGVTLTLLFTVALVLSFTDGNESKTTSPAAQTSTTVTETETKATKQTPGDKTVKTETSSPTTIASKTDESTPSEGVLLALLASGVVLALAGALYNRINSITLPGGAGIGLTSAETSQVVETVANKATEEASPPAVAAATATAIEVAQGKKVNALGKLEPQEIEQAAMTGLQAAGVATEEEPSDGYRRLNVVLQPRSEAHEATRPPAPQAGRRSAGSPIAPGFAPQPSWNLAYYGGRTIPNLAFVNCYVGGETAWTDEDTTKIDAALRKAMSDANLQAVIGQYFEGPVTSQMIGGAKHTIEVGSIVYKDTAEALAAQLHGLGILEGHDPASSVINVMLPRGVILSDGFSPRFKPSELDELTAKRRKHGTIRLHDDDAADSRHGLGGYHGSLLADGGQTVYYAVGVYSDGGNGIAAFDEPWKNVVATFYHELNETRTDADVEQVNSVGNENLLGWYSQAGGGEIGDLPVNACGPDLSLVFQEVPLADNSGRVPVQLMWSNRANGPAASL